MASKVDQDSNETQHDPELYFFVSVLTNAANTLTKATYRESANYLKNWIIIIIIINCNDIVAITIFRARYLKNPALGYPLKKILGKMTFDFLYTLK